MNATRQMTAAQNTGCRQQRLGATCIVDGVGDIPDTRSPSNRSAAGRPPSGARAREVRGSGLRRGPGGVEPRVGRARGKLAGRPRRRGAGCILCRCDGDFRRFRRTALRDRAPRAQRGGCPGLAYVGLDRRGLWPVRSRPFRIGAGAATEVRFSTPVRPPQLWLHSYLSLNREPVPVSTRLAESTGPSGVAPVSLSRPSDWRPPRGEGIVVDDLDPGFRTWRRPARTRLIGRGPDVRGVPGERAVDGGLSEYRWDGGRPGEWQREAELWAWGEYRRTLVRAIADSSGELHAAFEAVLPTPGPWRLEFHIPHRPSPELPGMPARAAHVDRLGVYRLRVAADDREYAETFDGGAAHGGRRRRNQLMVLPAVDARPRFVSQFPDPVDGGGSSHRNQRVASASASAAAVVTVVWLRAGKATMPIRTPTVRVGWPSGKNADDGCGQQTARRHGESRLK